jgi:hypothetical protein
MMAIAKKVPVRRASGVDYASGNGRELRHKIRLDPRAQNLDGGRRPAFPALELRLNAWQIETALALLRRFFG